MRSSMCRYLCSFRWICQACRRTIESRLWAGGLWIATWRFHSTELVLITLQKHIENS